MSIDLNRREIATLLAALRYWQATPYRFDRGLQADIATDHGTLTPLTADEIGDLCERLNTAPAAPSADAERLRGLAFEQYHRDGEIEIPEDAAVSVFNDGAYVAAWVWVDHPDGDETETLTADEYLASITTTEAQA
jgi:hypothetical protein